MQRNEEQPIEQADQAGNAIVTPRDERVFTIHPLVRHAFRPSHAHGFLLLLLRSVARDVALSDAVVVVIFLQS